MADDFKPVELVSPDGRPYTATTALECTNLIYGHGYRKVEPRPATKVEALKPDSGKKSDNAN